jgi:hypothetical protein
MALKEMMVNNETFKSTFNKGPVLTGLLIDKWNGVIPQYTGGGGVPFTGPGDTTKN